MQFEKMGDYHRAKEQYERAIEEDAGFSPAHRSLGILHLRRGNFEKAVKELHTALERNPGDDEAQFFMGTSFMYMECFDEAIEEFLTLSRSVKFSAASAHALGGLYTSAGDYTHGIIQLRKAHRQNVENSDTLALMACTYRKMGEKEKADI